MSAIPKHEEILARLLTLDIKNRVLWNLLEKRLSKERVRLRKKPSVVILSVGCGSSEETRVLSAFFGGNPFDSPSSKVRVIGIDNDPALIEMARTLAGIPSPTEPQKPYVVAPNCLFVPGDATNLSAYPEVPIHADVVWLRHQFLASDILQKSRVWSRILVEALSRLAPEGILVGTSYRETENQLLLDSLKLLKCDILGNYLNEEAICQEIPHMPDSSFDKCLVVARRPSTLTTKK